MNPNIVSIVLFLILILYFHFLVHTSIKDLKLKMEMIIQDLVKKEIENLNLMPLGSPCSHKFELHETLGIKQGSDHVGNTYVSRCTLCGTITSECVRVNT